MGHHAPHQRVHHLGVAAPGVAVLALAQPGQVEHLLPALAQQAHRHVRHLAAGQARVDIAAHRVGGLLGAGLALLGFAHPLGDALGAGPLVAEERFELRQQLAEQGGVFVVIVDDGVHRPVDALVGFIVVALLRVPLAAGAGQGVEQQAGVVLFVAEEGLVGDRHLQKRDLQPADQRLDFRGQALVVEDEVEQHGDQVDDVVVGLIQGVDGLAVLALEQVGELVLNAAVLGVGAALQGMLKALQAGKQAEQVLAADRLHRRIGGERGAVQVGHAVVHDRHAGGGRGATAGHGRAGAGGRGRTGSRRAAGGAQPAQGGEQFLKQAEHGVVRRRRGRGALTRRGRTAGGAGLFRGRRSARAGGAGTRAALAGRAAPGHGHGFHIRQHAGVGQHLVGLVDHGAGFVHHHPLEQFEHDQAGADIQGQPLQAGGETRRQVARLQGVVPFGDVDLAFEQVLEAVLEGAQGLVVALAGAAGQVVQGDSGFQLFVFDQRQVFHRHLAGGALPVVRGAGAVLEQIAQRLPEAGLQGAALQAQFAHGVEVAVALAVGLFLGQIEQGVVGAVEHVRQQSAGALGNAVTHALERPGQAQRAAFTAFQRLEAGNFGHGTHLGGDKRELRSPLRISVRRVP